MSATTAYLECWVAVYSGTTVFGWFLGITWNVIDRSDVIKESEGPEVSLICQVNHGVVDTVRSQPFHQLFELLWICIHHQWIHQILEYGRPLEVRLCWEMHVSGAFPERSQIPVGRYYSQVWGQVSGSLHCRLVPGKMGEDIVNRIFYVFVMLCVIEGTLSCRNRSFHWMEMEIAPCL